jgi:predicted methyltransferase
MRTVSLAVLVALALPAAAFAQHATTKADTAAIAAAVKDPARQADAAKDAQRKVADIAAFAGIRPGAKVLELIPGSGYFTRVFSATVGPKGHVYAVVPNEYDAEEAAKFAEVTKLPQYANVSTLNQPANQLTSPEKVDIAFTAQNYHDYPDKFMGSVDPVALDKQVFDALKPGGIFVVIDHVAEAGSGMRDTNTLHRIDPAIVKKQVVAAGFVFDGESKLLHNSADTHKLKVFDPKIRGKTDQFVYRFRKPGG